LVNQIIDTHAGIEIELLLPKLYRPVDGVLLSGFDLGYRRQALSPTRGEIITGLRQMPAQIETILESQERYILELTHILVILKISFCRGINFPIALEALKLKEISYIHAEGYPSGELKHGPIAY